MDEADGVRMELLTPLCMYKKTLVYIYLYVLHVATKDIIHNKKIYTQNNIKCAPDVTPFFYTMMRFDN